MRIDDMNLEELKSFYSEKCKELDNLLNSDRFVWLENNKSIESDFYSFLNKYKIYYYKKKAFLLELDNIKDILSKIEINFIKKYDYSDELLLTKKFDKESIL